MNRPQRVRRSALVAVGAALVLAGCADVPDSGPVNRVDAGASLEDGFAYYDPPPPQPGASPFEVVQGFYKAMLVYPITTKDAEDFMTAEAAESWDPTERTVVYETQVSAQSVGHGVVEAEVSRLGELDERGHYWPTPPTQLVETRRLHLEQEHGEWRIADPPDALYVDSYFFSRTYEPYSLYFISPSGDMMVPEPVYLPRGQQPYTQQPATLLVRTILEGPAPQWRGQLRTAIPPDTGLDGSVSISRDDIAAVRLLGPSIIELPPDKQRLLSAQLVWTLAQLPGLDGVRILADGAALQVPGVPAVQDLDQWSVFDPSRSPSRGQLYGLGGDGRLVQILPRRGSRRLSESLWGVESRGIRSFDVDVGLEQVLAVSADGRRLLTGPLYASAGQRPRTLFTGGTDLATPVYASSVEEGSPQWLVVDRTTAGPSRLLVSDGKGVRVRPMDGLERYRVESLSLSPDGMRFAALARPATAGGFGEPRIVIGRVLRSPDGTSVVGLAEPRELVVSGHTLDRIRSVGWTDATTLAVLAQPDGGALAAVTVRIDGSVLTGEWFIPESIKVPTRLLVSAGADHRAYLVDGGQRLWVEADDGQWVQTGAVGVGALNFAG
jgi:hypothetical protein